MKHLPGGLFLIAMVAGCGVPKKDYEALNAKYNAEVTRATQLEQQLGASNERQKALEGKAAELQSSVAEMEQALAELRSRKAEADAQVAAFKDLLAKFRDLIDAGTLSVKIVDGRMVVALATDILFSSGSADLSPVGKESLAKVAAVLVSIPDRNFQVEGHTDNDPIKTAKYPSNWELASARAITVVRALNAGGLPPSRVSAASFAEHRPTASNDSKEGKLANRRIEIVVQPDLSSLPGFQQLSELTGK